MVKHEKTLQQFKSEIEGLEEQEAGVQESLLDLKHELEQYSTSLKDSEKKIKYYQNEVCATSSGFQRYLITFSPLKMQIKSCPWL